MAKIGGHKKQTGAREVVRQSDYMPPELHVLFFREGEWWVAQCLQYDINAQARTIEDIYYQFEYAVNAHIATRLENNLTPFVDLDPAPQEYWDMWKKALPLEKAPVPRFRASRHIPAQFVPKEKAYRVGDLVASH